MKPYSAMKAYYLNLINEIKANPTGLFKDSNCLFLIYVSLIIFCVMNTGLTSDDLGHMFDSKKESLAELLTPNENYINVPVLRYTHHISYSLIEIDKQDLLNLFKVSYVILSFCLISSFFSIYLEKKTAFFLSFLFIFFPSHDSTVYLYLAQYLTLTFAFYFYAFYLAHNSRMIYGFFWALIASFTSYGSPAIAVSLFILFVIQKEWKKGMVILIPNIIFSIHFIISSELLSLSKPRFMEKIELTMTIKLYIFQIMTFMDSMFGPSMWLKIYYSFFQLSGVSWLIGILLAVVFSRTNWKDNSKYNPNLIICFSILTLSSFLMFAMTGLYPQLTFNLGNRTTIFGSLLISYLIVLMPVQQKVKNVFFAILLLSIIGISDHWKEWSRNQQTVFENIKNNQDFLNYDENDLIYVSGNQYSRYGPISHIELFSERWSAVALLIILERDISVAIINKRFIYANGLLTDTKYNKKLKVGRYINIYDSESNKLFKLKADKINDYIKTLPEDNRHWVMLSNNALTNIIKSIAVKFMPRLEYAFSQ